MLIPILDGAIALVSKVFDKIPDPKLRDELKAEALKASTDAANLIAAQATQIAESEMDLLKTQIAVNAAEAASPHMLLAGWRPFVAWSSGCVVVFVPLLSWALQGILKFPSFPAEYYNVIATVFASLAGVRMVEKVKGVASGSLVQSVASAVVKLKK